MRNFISQGNTLSFTNETGADIASGDGVVIGSIFGVAAGIILNDEEGVINVVGVYELPKAGSEAWELGAPVYWADGAATTAGGDLLIGVAYGAVDGSADATVGRVRLNASFGA